VTRPADPLRAALAAITSWLEDDRELGRAVAAEAIDRDPVGFLDAVGGMWLIVADVAHEGGVEVPTIVRDVALGVAQAEAEDGHP
jgi:hypothetical protein